MVYTFATGELKLFVAWVAVIVFCVLGCQSTLCQSAYCH